MLWNPRTLYFLINRSSRAFHAYLSMCLPTGPDFERVLPLGTDRSAALLPSLYFRPLVSPPPNTFLDGTVKGTKVGSLPLIFLLNVWSNLGERDKMLFFSQYFFMNISAKVVTALNYITQQTIEGNRTLNSHHFDTK